MSMSSGLTLIKQKNATRQADSVERRQRTFFSALRAVLAFRKYRVGPAEQVAASNPAHMDEARERMMLTDQDDWQARNSAILSLPALFADAAGSEDALKSAVEAMREPLSSQLADLRSAIVRSACTVLRDIVLAHGAPLAPLVSHVLPQLLLNLALLKVVAAPSAATAKAVLGAGGAPSIGAFKVLLEHAKDTRKQVRQGSFELLGVLLANRAVTIPPKGLAAALAALEKGVVDADGATRGNAAKAYWAAAAYYPGKQCTEWLAKLGPKEKKLVEKNQPRTPRTATLRVDADPVEVAAVKEHDPSTVEAEAAASPADEAQQAG